MGKSTWSLEVLVTIEMLYNQQFVNHIIHGACCTCGVREYFVNYKFSIFLKIVTLVAGAKPFKY